MPRWRGPPESIRLRTVGEVARESYESWRAHRTVRLGAAVAYYGLFALVPIVAVTLVLVSVFIADANVEDSVAAVFGDILDTSDQAALADAVSRELDATGSRTGLGLVGFVGLLIGGSLLFVALADAANLIWDVPIGRGIRTSLRRRVFAFAIVLAFAALVVGAAALRWASGLLAHLVPSGPLVVGLAFGLLEWVGSLAALAGIVTILFRALAPVRVGLVPAATAGTATALVLTMVSGAFGTYLDLVFTSSLTGAAGGVLVFLLWMYAIAQVLLAGMHLARTLDDRAAIRSPDPGDATDSSSVAH